MNFGDIYKPKVKPLKEPAPAPAPAQDGLTKYVYVAPPSHRVVDLIRVMKGSIVGYNINRCSNCKGRIEKGGKKDRFCRHCGYRLDGDEDA